MENDKLLDDNLLIMVDDLLQYDNKDDVTKIENKSLLEKDQYYMCELSKLDRIDLKKQQIKMNGLAQKQLYFDIFKIFDIKDETDVIEMNVMDNIYLRMVIQILVINNIIELTISDNYKTLHKIETSGEKTTKTIFKKYKGLDYRNLLLDINKYLNIVYEYMDYFSLNHKNYNLIKSNNKNKEFDYIMLILEDNKNMKLFVKDSDFVTNTCFTKNLDKEKTIYIESITEKEFFEKLNHIIEKIEKVNIGEETTNNIKLKGENFEYKIQENKSGEKKYGHYNKQYYYHNRNNYQQDYKNWYGRKRFNFKNKKQYRKIEINDDKNTKKVDDNIINNESKSEMSDLIELSDLNEIINDQ
jgi:hypothetical protein